MSKDKRSPKPGQFCWNELATTNVAAAKKFYAGLLGWKTAPFGKGADYTLFKQGSEMAGGLMKCQQPGVLAHWISYVMVNDVDAIAKKATKLRGKVLVPPFDVAGAGRIAVLRDPQGAVIGLFKPE
jgi:hypothetical protein